MIVEYMSVYLFNKDFEVEVEVEVEVDCYGWCR